MKQETKEKLLSMSLNENNSSTFVAQIVACAIVGGVALHSFWLFAALLVPPLVIFFCSARVIVFHYAAMVLCGIYPLAWGAIGYMIGGLFPTSLGVLFSIVLLIPGVLYNWLAFCYFLYE